MSIRFITLQIISLYLGIIILNVPCFSQDHERELLSELHSKLIKIKGIYVKKIEPLPGFKEGFEIAMIQPVDHNHPGGAKFTQRVFLSQRDCSKPVVLETEGYGIAWPKERELAKILDANQIIVEHRYYESSKPKPLKWEYLTSWQAASDHHRIIEILKTIYPGKWISSGRSKGGMAALFHRAHYPNDVDATLVYVAPIMSGPKDARFERFMNSVGDYESREKIKQFQRACLERRTELLPLLKNISDQQKLTFPCGIEKVFEWIVIEFPYSFWSGNHKCNEIPQPEAPIEPIFDFLNKVNPFFGLTDRQLKYNSALYYQQYTELGYYGYPISHLKELLEVVEDPDFSFYVPQDALKATFNKEAMIKVLDYLQNKGNNIIYLYGEKDIWTACAVELTGKTNSIKLIAKGKGHLFDLNDFPTIEKEQVFSLLEEWLQIKIKR